MAQGAFEHNDAQEKALQYPGFSMNNALPPLVENSQLFTLKDQGLKTGGRWSGAS